MSENLKDYMTEEEQQQVDALLTRAEKRMRKKQATGHEHQFLFLGCQCECYQTMVQQNQEHQEKIDFGKDIQELLWQICHFCKRHRGCFREGRMEGEVDEDLPF